MTEREDLELTRAILRQIKNRADAVVDDYLAGNADLSELTEAADCSDSCCEVLQAIDELLQKDIEQGESDGKSD